MKPIQNLLFLMVCFSLAFLPVAGAEETKESLKQRFAGRHQALLKLKQSGAVGETYLGFVEARPNASLDDAAKTLLSDENADRRTLNALLAAEQDTTAEEVGRQSAIFKFRMAGPEEWFKGRDGTWRQKKDMLAKAGE